ncbi:39S ribosomal protein L1, mitochondrial [Dirofilaria immitis]|nr:39S ribosomal protein L1, mitochondrial [Dirofilaria immitis]
MGHAEFCLLFPSIYNLQQYRGRKRNLKRALTKQERQERRLKREAKEAERKKYTFMQRIQISRMKNMASISEQFPGRLNPAKEAHLPDKPTTNVYIRSAYKTQYYSVSEALQMHREMQQPSIYNNPNARVRLRMELNMTTEKKTKMVNDSEELVPIPYPFKHNEKRTILAFACEQHNRDAAIEAGAEIALGPDMIKRFENQSSIVIIRITRKREFRIIKGMFRIDDYDFCVAHTDMASSILPLRGILRSRFPNKINGGLGDNFEEIIGKFKNGVKLIIRGDPVMPIWGLCDTVVGRIFNEAKSYPSLCQFQLTMKDEELEANIAAVIGALCKHRNPALGPFINRALIMVIPGDAHFALNVSPFLPIPTEQEIEKADSSGASLSSAEA